MEQIAVYGAGDQGRLVAWTIEAINDVENKFELVCFIDDAINLQGQSLNGIPILDFDTAVSTTENLKIVAGIGKPIIREQVMEMIASLGLETISLIYPNVQKTRWVEIGKGTVIAAGCIISSNIIIGAHVNISPNCVIGHDAIIEDYVSIGPGLNLGGHVHIGERAFIGLGVSVISGKKDKPIVIGKDAVVGAGACVIKSVPAGATVVGVPAKPIHQ